ncbi:MAG: ATP-binding protein [Candidatus Electrothrix sp. YB6]
MKRDVKITSSGIKKVLKRYKCYHGVAEYIWNGFDAKARTVEINYELDKLGVIEQLSIKDDGHGIDLDNLKEKFDKFYDSEKTIQIQSPKHSSILHGKNGVGRLTFFTFADHAEWHTAYENGGITSGVISVSAWDLKRYQVEKNKKEESRSGTTVIFNNLTISQNDMEGDIIPYLKKEFCWFLELNKSKDYRLIVNGEPIDYEQLICDNDEFELNFEEKTFFGIRFFQWREPLNKEYSRFYYLDSSQKEIFKRYTTMNRKGDHFYHSVFIVSDFFKDFDFSSNEDSTQLSLFTKARNSVEYKFLHKELGNYLRLKRKPYLRDYALAMVEEFEKNGILPEYKNDWDVLRKNELKDTIISLYEVQPKIFSNLNLEQKKTFVRFLDLLLDSNEREHILTILEEVASLESEVREELAGLFKSTRLNRIISTIKLIEDRYRTYYILKELVFNSDLKANEVNHLQTLIENNYWFFGEQYHLVTAAEPKFEEALRRYVYEISGTIYDRKIEHLDKNREMDIFACRQNKLTDTIENVVVELKHNRINLGQKEYLQVLRYIDVIKKQPEFNASNITWKFYLVGKRFDTSGFIEVQIETNKPHGEKGLLLYQDNGRIKFYAKTWSEIFTEFELRHNFIDEKLKLEREALFAKEKTANELVEISIANSAVSLKEVQIPVAS